MTTAYFRGTPECCRPRSGRTSTSGTTTPRRFVTPVRTVGMPGTGVTESTGKTSRMLWRSMANRLLERVIRQTRAGKPACGETLAYSSTDLWGPARSIKDQSPVDLPTSRENFLDCRQEVFRLKGLRDVRTRTLLLAPELVAFLSVRRTEDHRDVLEPGVILQTPASLKAVAAQPAHL